MKRSRQEIARAVLRLSGENQVPVERLRERTAVSTRALVRWITEGRGGVFLDGVRRPGVGWVPSAAALERFFQALLAAAPQDADELARLRARPGA